MFQTTIIRGYRHKAQSQHDAQADADRELADIAKGLEEAGYRLTTFKKPSSKRFAYWLYAPSSRLVRDGVLKPGSVLLEWCQLTLGQKRHAR